MRIPDSVSKLAGKQLLALKKHSPHILFGAGIAGVVTSTVLACKATLKVGDKLDAIHTEVENVKNDVLKPHLSHRYSTQQAYTRRDLAFVYGHGIFDIGKLYAPSVLLGVVSIAALTGSHVTMTRRNSALSAAYVALAKTLTEYRERVREEVGEDKERELYHNAELVVVQNEDGTTSKAMKLNGKCADEIYCRIFGPDNRNWKNNSEYNLNFLKANEAHWNTHLRVHKYVFLNDVLEDLGMEKTREGQIVGWIYDQERGDGYIDFGIFLLQENADALFSGGQTFFLEFNCDGPILNRI